MNSPSIPATSPPTTLLQDIREVVRDVRSAKGLIYQLTVRDIKVRYKQALMGFGWAILSPLLIVSAGVIVRIAMLHLSGQPLESGTIAGIVVKGLGWSFFAATLGFSTTALTGNAALISKVYFPRETLPISVVLASAFDSLIGTSAMAVILTIIGWRPTMAALWMVLLAALLFVLTLAASLIVSCANLFYRDAKYIAQLFITFGIFFTPVFFEPALLGARWVPWQMLNPLAPLLEGLRLSVVEGHNLLVPIVQASDGALVWSPAYLAYGAAVAIFGLLVSVIVFHRAQYKFAEYV